MLIESNNFSAFDASALHNHINGGFIGDKEMSPKSLNLADMKYYSTFKLKAAQLAEEKKIQQQQMKRKIRKNLLVLSGGNFLLFLSYIGLSNIESSINDDGGLGTSSLCVIYTALVFSSMFIASPLIKKLGYKWTLVLSPIMLGAFVTANFYSTWETLIPVAVLWGLAFAPFWSAQSTYLTKISQDYAFLTGETSDIIVVRFFGFFFMMMQTGQIFGNSISSVILKTEEVMPISKEQLAICGANYCNEKIPFYENFTFASENSSSNSIFREDALISQVYMLLVVYLACALCSSVLMAIFLSPLEGPSDEAEGLQLLLATLKQMKDPKQILLIPMTVYNGLQLGFMIGDLTKAMVTCSLGVDKVGYVMMCLYISNALSCMVWGIIIKKIGRIPIITFGAIINFSISFVMLYWHPEPQKIYVFFIIPSLWGIGDSVWATQNSSIYGVLFPNNLEAAYSNLRVWESLGMIISFGVSNYLCFDQKVEVILGLLIITMISYYGLEYFLVKRFTTEKLTTEKATTEKFTTQQKRISSHYIEHYVE